MGPYIWKIIESKTYDVELPDGRQVYLVKFLDGFISKSWLDYVSFGEIGTGGWIDGDVVKGKYGAYCNNKCGMNVGRVMGAALSDSQVKSLLDGKKTLVKGL